MCLDRGSQTFRHPLFHLRQANDPSFSQAHWCSLVCIFSYKRSDDDAKHGQLARLVKSYRLQENTLARIVCILVGNRQRLHQSSLDVTEENLWNPPRISYRLLLLIWGIFALLLIWCWKVYVVDFGVISKSLQLIYVTLFECFCLCTLWHAFVCTLEQVHSQNHAVWIHLGFCCFLSTFDIFLWQILAFAFYPADSNASDGAAFIICSPQGLNLKPTSFWKAPQESYDLWETIRVVDSHPILNWCRHCSHTYRASISHF